MLTQKIFRVVPLLICGLVGRAALAAPGYDPLAVPAGFAARTVELTVHDGARNRDLPIKVYLPGATIPEPVVIFSHGLGGSRENDAFLGQHWAARNYVAVFIQHPGSDESVWQGKGMNEAMLAMKQAAGLKNFLARVKDVPAILDQLDYWNRKNENALFGRLDTKHIGMSGHSFGAVTTQAVSGESMGGRPMFTDERIKAACMFSPSVPKRGDAKAAFRTVTIPWLLMTGTKDTAPIGDQTVEDRLGVFPALPAGQKYEVVLDGAEHSAFGDRPLPGDKEPRNPNHHRVMLALTTAFWDAYLRGDAAAKTWLDGDGPTGVLEKADRWRKK